MSGERNVDGRMYRFMRDLFSTYRVLHTNDNPIIPTYGNQFDKALALGLEKTIFDKTTDKGAPESIKNVTNKLYFVDTVIGVTCPSLKDIWVLSHIANITQPNPPRYNEERFELSRNLAARLVKKNGVDDNFKYFVKNVIEAMENLENESDKLPISFGINLRY